MVPWYRQVSGLKQILLICLWYQNQLKTRLYSSFMELCGDKTENKSCSFICDQNQLETYQWNVHSLSYVVTRLKTNHAHLYVIRISWKPTSEMFIHWVVWWQDWKQIMLIYMWSESAGNLPVKCSFIELCGDKTENKSCSFICDQNQLETYQWNVHSWNYVVTRLKTNHANIIELSPSISLEENIKFTATYFGKPSLLHRECSACILPFSFLIQTTLSTGRNTKFHHVWLGRRSIRPHTSSTASAASDDWPILSHRLLHWMLPGDPLVSRSRFTRLLRIGRQCWGCDLRIDGGSEDCTRWGRHSQASHRRSRSWLHLARTHTLHYFIHYVQNLCNENRIYNYQYV